MATSSINGLSTFFTTVIQDLMVLEQAPLARITAARDQLNLRKSVYDDVSTQLKALQASVKALTSTSSKDAMQAGRSVSISDAPTGYTVLSASASSSAAVGSYTLSDITLAQAHRVRSDRQMYANQALGKVGTILMGGDATRSVNAPTSLGTTVTGFGSATALASAQTELGNDTYYVETRQEGEVWQFRLVNSDGAAVSVRKDSGDTFTDDWQAITAGTYDSGRGLQIDFGASGYEAASRATENAAQVTYRAQGASLSIAASDTLEDIAAKINSAKYAAGNGISATVVDRQLVLSAAQTGVTHKIIASGQILGDLGILGADGGSGDLGAADGYKNTLQHAVNSSFTINGVQVVRSANTNLTDVITGVTLNLAADAAGRSATLNIGANWQTARASVDSFVEEFNKTQTYLEAKMAITRVETGDNITYTRGALAGDSIFGDLRTNLMFGIGNAYNSGGVYQSLREIGITMDDNLALSVSDSAKLEAALNNDPDEVQKLLNGVMENFDTQLSRFTGTSNVEGYLDSASKNLAADLKEANADISDFEERLVAKEAFYTEQYGQLQAQMLLLSYQQQTWQSIYGQTSSYA